MDTVQNAQRRGERTLKEKLLLTQRARKGATAARQLESHTAADHCSTQRRFKEEKPAFG